MTSSRRHSPFAGAVWMMVAGLCFAAVNSLSQYVSFTLGLPSTQVAFHQYLIALVCLLPWLVRHGLRQSLMTNQLRLHLLRVAVASFASAFLWSLVLSMVGKMVMATPVFAHHQELLTKCLLVTSFGLFVIAVAAIGMRLLKRPSKRVR